MNPWPAPSVPRQDKQKHRRRRQAGGGDIRDGRTERRGGQRRTVQRRVTRSGPHGRREAKRTRRRSGPARTSAIGGEPRRRCKLEQGDHARKQRAEERHSGGDRPPAERQNPTHMPAASRPPTPRPGIATRMGRNPPRPAKGSVARGAAPSDRARSEGGGREPRPKVLHLQVRQWIIWPVKWRTAPQPATINLWSIFTLIADFELAKNISLKPRR